jgi:hypothetical protein
MLRACRVSDGRCGFEPVRVARKCRVLAAVTWRSHRQELHLTRRALSNGRLTPDIPNGLR